MEKLARFIRRATFAAPNRSSAENRGARWQIARRRAAGPSQGAGFARRRVLRILPKRCLEREDFARKRMKLDADVKSDAMGIGRVNDRPSGRGERWPREGGAGSRGDDDSKFLPGSRGENGGLLRRCCATSSVTLLSPRCAAGNAPTVRASRDPPRARSA